MALCVSGCAVGLNPRAVDVGSDSAQLRGDVVTNTGGDVTYWFEWGKTASYGFAGAHILSGVPKEASQPVNELIDRLDAGTTYHFHVCAQDSQEGAGPGCSQDQTFETVGVSGTPSAKR
jgi:hypothetical protein